VSHPEVRLVGVEWPGRCVNAPRGRVSSPRARGSRRGAVQRCQGGRRSPLPRLPDPEQAGRLAGWGHSCRAVWNLALAQRDHLYRHRGVTLRANAQCVQLTRARRDLPWLADLPAQSAQQVLRQLDRAYGNWRFRLSRPLGGAVRNATVCRDGLGWQVSFGVATGAEPAAANGLPGCGVDFGGGVLGLCLRRDRTAAAGGHPDRRGNSGGCLGWSAARPARSAGPSGTRWPLCPSAGRTIAQIAKLRARQARRRLDFTHKLTSDLAKSHGWVGIEDLRARGLTKSARGTALAPGRGVTAKAGLHRGILDNTPFERRRQLAYKAPRFGSELRLVPRRRAPPRLPQGRRQAGRRSRPGPPEPRGLTVPDHQNDRSLPVSWLTRKLRKKNPK
jgi:putative transposase